MNWDRQTPTTAGTDLEDVTSSQTDPAGFHLYEVRAVTPSSREPKMASLWIPPSPPGTVRAALPRIQALLCHSRRTSTRRGPPITTASGELSLHPWPLHHHGGGGGVKQDWQDQEGWQLSCPSPHTHASLRTPYVRGLLLGEPVQWSAAPLPAPLLMNAACSPSELFPAAQGRTLPFVTPQSPLDLC